MPREQKMLKGRLPRVIDHEVYLCTTSGVGGFSRRGSGGGRGGVTREIAESAGVSGLGSGCRLGGVGVGGGLVGGRRTGGRCRFVIIACASAFVSVEGGQGYRGTSSS